MTTWTDFLSKNAGKGYTRSQLSKLYKDKNNMKNGIRKTSVKKSKALSRKPRKYSRQICREITSEKIKENMKEYKGGRYASPQQAIAVSYSQVIKRYPKCSRHLKKK